MLPDIAHPHPQILGALSETPSFVEILGYQLNGLVVVFTALGSIWLLLEVIGSFFRRAEARATERARLARAAAAHAEASAPAGTDLATIAVIAAAVHHVIGKRHRIVAVTPELDRDWAREGRRQIFSSHQVR